MYIENLLNVEDAARILKVSRTHVYDLIRRGQLPFIQVGARRKTLRIDSADLYAFIEEHSHLPKTEVVIPES